MEVILQGRYDDHEIAASLSNIIKLFKDRYRIAQFREVHLSVTLMDEAGMDVELIDTETKYAYRVLEVYKHNDNRAHTQTSILAYPVLKLVIDNA